MSEEQIIYISPEDDLTSIRERLEKVQSKRVTLVIPANTQLRSHVAWKLLYVRARELSKEVLIVSSDAQIRSVAHAVKFRVATSLEASEASAPAKSRPPSRPGRSTVGSRGRTSSTGSMRSVSGRIDTRASDSAGSARSRSATPLYGRGHEHSLAQPDLELESHSSQPEDTITGGSDNLPPKRYGSSTYDFRIDTAPPIRPLPPQQLDEEPDLLLEDMNIARDIREAALGGRAQAESPARPEEETAEAAAEQNLPPTIPRLSHLPEIADDPFAYMEDALPPPLPAEQRGSVSRQQLETSEHEIQDVPDMPTNMRHDNAIEYQDDAGAFLPASSLPAQSDEWAVPEPGDEEETPGPSGSYHVYPHSSLLRNAGNVTPLPSKQPGENEDEQDDVAPLEDQPTRVMPPGPLSTPPTRPSQKPAASMRRSAPLRPGTSAHRSSPLQAGEVTSRRSAPLSPPGTTSRRSVPLQQADAAPRRSAPLQSAERDRTGAASETSSPQSGSSRSALNRTPSVPLSRSSRTALTSPGVSGRGRQAAPARAAGRRTLFLLIAAILLLVVLAGSLAYFGPSANVVLTLQSHVYTHSLSLSARPGIQQDATPGMVAAYVQKQSFTHSGTAIASGSKRVGKDPATGSVTFTNKGQRPIIIPTGTIISTPSGIQFTTDAELSVNVPGKPGDPVPVPVHAVAPGDNGNLPAGTITVIPQDSLNAIARNNSVSPTDLALQVSNNQPTSGGGLGTVHTILQQDLNTTKQNLSAQVQPDITTWLKQWTTAGISSKPTMTATLVGSPQDGQTVDNVNVPVTLNVIVSVLVVHNDDLQKAAATQLNALMKHDPNYRNDVVPANVQQAIKINSQKVISNDATALTFNGNATAQVVPAISQDEMRRELTGMSIKSAQETLAQTPGVEHADIKVSPAFVSWLPFRTERINVILNATAPPTK